MNDTAVKKLQEMVDESRYIVFFGGAGVSTESGIPDFRSQDGLYSQTYKYPPEQMVSRSFYDRHKKEFFDFYRDKMLALDAKPNPAHLKLAELEKAGKLKAVITQNIDGLHQKAGSQNVIELHGSVHRNYCRTCGREYPGEFIRDCEGLPVCECGGEVKPDVVLYEESLNGGDINRAVKAISNADMLVIGGTSLVVYPAAGLVDYFKGKNLVVVNKTETGRSERANLVITDPIGSMFEKIEVR